MESFSCSVLIRNGISGIFFFQRFHFCFRIFQFLIGTVNVFLDFFCVGEQLGAHTCRLFCFFFKQFQIILCILLFNYLVNCSRNFFIAAYKEFFKSEIRLCSFSILSSLFADSCLTFSHSSPYSFVLSIASCTSSEIFACSSYTFSNFVFSVPV